MTRTTVLTIAVAMFGLGAAIPTVLAQSAAAPSAQQSAQQNDAQDHQAHQPAPGLAQAANGADGSMAGMQHRMMADMQARDAEIQTLLASMNAASGNAKIDAMAQVVTALVDQHKAMCEGMMPMQGPMTMPMMMKPHE